MTAAISSDESKKLPRREPGRGWTILTDPMNLLHHGLAESGWALKRLGRQCCRMTRHCGCHDTQLSRP